MKMKKRGTLVVLHRNAAILMDGNLDTIILLDVVYQLVHLGKCQCHYCIGSTIVDGNTSCLSVTECGAGEAYVGHVAYALIHGLGMKNVWLAAVFYLPGLFLVQNRSTHIVDHTVTGLSDTVEDHKPPFIDLDGNGTCADLGPGPVHGCQYMVMLTPVDHIGRLAQEHITERGMSVVGRTREHDKLPVYLSGEQYTVAVERNERIGQSVEGLEVIGICHADGGTLALLKLGTPGYIVFVLNETHSGVISVRIADEITGCLIV